MNECMINDVFLSPPLDNIQTILVLQSGQLACRFSHVLMHSAWKVLLQQKYDVANYYSLSGLRQIEQSDSKFITSSFSSRLPS